MLYPLPQVSCMIARSLSHSNAIRPQGGKASNHFVVEQKITYASNTMRPQEGKASHHFVVEKKIA